MADRIPGAPGAALAAAANRGFVSGMDLGFTVAAAVVALAGVIVLVALPNRPPKEPDLLSSGIGDDASVPS